MGNLLAIAKALLSQSVRTSQPVPDLLESRVTLKAMLGAHPAPFENASSRASRTQGRMRCGVEIRWELEAGECRLLWPEIGGPSVTLPKRKGFGSEVIEWAVAQAVGGQLTMDFRRAGLRFPLHG